MFIYQFKPLIIVGMSWLLNSNLLIIFLLAWLILKNLLTLIKCRKRSTRLFFWVKLKRKKTNSGLILGLKPRGMWGWEKGSDGQESKSDWDVERMKDSKGEKDWLNEHMLSPFHFFTFSFSTMSALYCVSSSPSSSFLLFVNHALT